MAGSPLQAALVTLGAAVYTASLAPALLRADGVSGGLAVAAMLLACVLAGLAVRRGGLRKLLLAAPLLATAVPGWLGEPGLAFAAGLAAAVLLGRDLWAAAALRSWARHRPALERLVLPHAALVLFVVAFVAFYGQLDRKQSGDTYAMVYTSAAIVQHGSVQLDRYLPILQARAGERPYQISYSANGHLYGRPLAPGGAALVAAPAVAALLATGTKPAQISRFLELSSLLGALLAAGAVATMFVALTRLTTRTRAFALAAVFGFATSVWTISGQGLWQQTPALLALTLGLLALIDKRPAAAGFALGAMVAVRPSTLGIAVLLFALVGRRPWALGRAALAFLPPVLLLASFNRAAYGCVQCLGAGHSPNPLSSQGGFSGSILDGLTGNLISPGRGLFVLMPVLLFAVAGAVAGFRQPLYRWLAIAAAEHILLSAHWFQWWGGEVFGPRQLVDALPLLALLLVPAVTRWGESPRFRRAFVWLTAWSVAVQFLGAALWPGTRWYDHHDPARFRTWWNPTDTDVTAFFSNPQRLVERGGLQALILVGALAAGLLTALVAARLPQRQAQERAAPEPASPLLRWVSLLPYLCVPIAAPWLLHADLAGGEPRGGFVIAIALTALVLAVVSERPTVSGLPLLVLPFVAHGDCAWAVLAAGLSLVLALAERHPVLRGFREEAPIPASAP